MKMHPIILPQTSVQAGLSGAGCFPRLDEQGAERGAWGRGMGRRARSTGTNCDLGHCKAPFSGLKQAWLVSGESRQEVSDPSHIQPDTCGDLTWNSCILPLVLETPRYTEQLSNLVITHDAPSPSMATFHDSLYFFFFTLSSERNRTFDNLLHLGIA